MCIRDSFYTANPAVFFILFISIIQISAHTRLMSIWFLLLYGKKICVGLVGGWVVRVRACVGVHILACMGVHMHACMHACVRTCMHACMCAGMRACVHGCMNTCMHACMHTCMHAFMHACMPA